MRDHSKFLGIGAAVPTVLALVLAACGGGTTSPPQAQPIVTLPGQYDLVEYDGASLPVSSGIVLVGNSVLAGDNRSFSCPKMFTAATIQVGADGMASRTWHIAYPCTGTLPHPAIPDTATETESGTMQPSGDSVVFAYPSSSRGAGSEYARISGSDLVFYLLRQGSGVTGSVGPIHRVYRKK